MVVTRGIGVIAVAFVGTFFVLDQFDEGPGRTSSSTPEADVRHRHGRGLAIVAAADAIARRACHERGSNDLVATLPKGLKATKITKKDSHGWSVVAVRFAAGEGADPPRCTLS